LAHHLWSSARPIPSQFGFKSLEEGGLYFCITICSCLLASFTFRRYFSRLLCLFSSGYYRFKECGDVTNPTIGIEIGESYIFEQADISNWYHTLGFAYFPDGAHAERDELEPTISQTGSDCASTFTCPKPRYFRAGIFLGVERTEDFGLDVYEPDFLLNIVDWAQAGTYMVELMFDDAGYSKISSISAM
jgi:hypothetical protein